MHRLDLGLLSHPKEFLGNGVRTHLTSKGEIPSTGSSEQDQTCDAASCKTVSPTHYLLSYSGPVDVSVNVDNNNGEELVVELCSVVEDQIIKHC